MSVVVTAGARLHFGLLAVANREGRKFGGLGLMIDHPRVVVRVVQSGQDSILAPPHLMNRVTGVLTQYRQTSPGDMGPVLIEVRESLPPHSGLGSGTQLGLAVASGLAALEGRQLPATELALRAGRGLRSAVGIHGFDLGGLLLEAGKSSPDAIGTLLARVGFPDEWRVLLARSPAAPQMSGESEQASFARLAPMPSDITDRLCGLCVRDILPAAIERDFLGFSHALAEFGQTVGEYFRPVQGGVFADSRVNLLAEWLRQRDLPACVQSSWGPTACVFRPDTESAQELQHDLTRDARFRDWSFSIAVPLNRGATVDKSVTD